MNVVVAGSNNSLKFAVIDFTNLVIFFCLVDSRLWFWKFSD
jgi:hypothetical protein